MRIPIMSIHVKKLESRLATLHKVRKRSESDSFPITELHNSPFPAPSPHSSPGISAAARRCADLLVLALRQTDHDVGLAGAQCKDPDT